MQFLLLMMMKSTFQVKVICIWVGDLSVKHNVLVAEFLTQDCLLGSDFLVSIAWLCN